MARTVLARTQRFPVAGTFTIARGAKTHVDVVVATIRQYGWTAQGEATPIYYLGETAVCACAQIREASPLLSKRSVNEAREALQTQLPRVAARNTLDSPSSEEHRVRNECVRTCRSRGRPFN